MAIGVNRSRDVSQARNNVQTLALPSQYASEKEAIDMLFALGNNYNINSKVTYTGLPGQSQYNSNSFARGLGEPGGFQMPSPPSGNIHGWSTPLPPSNFQAP